jgi:hypothetical protein
MHNETNPLADALPPLPPTAAPGLYRHYKGNDYEVVGVATHSETHEPMVVYRPLYGEMGLWVRPLAMFMEDVTVDGKTVPRFAKI